jgi:hypothetical protein
VAERNAYPHVSTEPPPLPRKQATPVLTPARVWTRARGIVANLVVVGELFDGRANHVHRLRPHFFGHVALLRHGTTRVRPAAHHNNGRREPRVTLRTRGPTLMSGELIFLSVASISEVGSSGDPSIVMLRRCGVETGCYIQGTSERAT